jgi:hypothetical protein
MASMHVRSIVLFAFGLSVTAAVAPVLTQSLGDVAKKEEERRKSVSAPAKVYTNKDLTPVPGGSSPTAPVPAQPASPGATAPSSSADAAKLAEKGPVKDQAYWAGRHKGLQEKLDRDQTYLAALQTRINSLTTDFVNRDDPAQRAVIERDRQKTTAELARLQQEIVKGKQAIADFEEEARKAGVPPGWLR